jgi:hypothetical protein
LLWQAASNNAGGFGVNGVIGAGMRMMAAGMSMGQIQSVSRKVTAYKVLVQVLAYARGQVGAKTVGKAVVAIPGLSQFM